VEKTFQNTHGIEVGTFIRTRQEIEDFLSKVPFGDLKHSRQTYLIVTFLKRDANRDALTLLLQDTKSGLKSFDTELNVLCSVVNTTSEKTPDFMQKLEKLLSKSVTTRTLNTIERMAARL